MKPRKPRSPLPGTPEYEALKREKTHALNRAAAAFAGVVRLDPDQKPGTKLQPVEMAPTFRPLSEYEERKMKWLWKGWLPLGELTLLVGDPKAGKGLVSLELACRVSRGQAWPDGQKNTKGRVILLSAEDDIETVIKPRIRIHEGDQEQFDVLDVSSCATFSLARDLPVLREKIEETKARLVIIDPINSYIGGKIDSFKDTEIRSVLQPLLTLAHECRVAVIAVAHMNKNSKQAALHRVLGSIGYVGVARQVIFVVRDREEKTRRLFYLGAANNTEDGKARAYSIAAIDDIPHLTWEKGEVGLIGDELFSERKESQTDRAAKFIEARLKGRVVRAERIYREGQEQGFSQTVLDKAARRLDVQRSRERNKKGQTKRVTWALPDTFQEVA